ncbi:hypothetical protein PHYBOEH_010335 [Phytophthora boehmeriae]|uniref:Uncharacterized protein n=1 Tax=Phytophthora boehmeriae TaxID=109152 RepID=A0A8T1WZW0_9STRA|nr:hypothetical protein PHYBOEH_010335 [Phytophthora boehmeriae]
MLRLQCLLNVEEDDVSERVGAVFVPPDERISTLQARIEEEMLATQIQDQPSATLKLYCVQQKRLTYRQNPATKLEELFLDGAVISKCDTSVHEALQGIKQLVPWALVSWYFQDHNFAFPDAIDVVAVWEKNTEIE